MISWKRLESCLRLKRWYCQGNWQQKSEERILASFSSYYMRSFYSTFFLQQFLKLMSKMKNYDGSSCIAKMLNFGSQTLKMLEFTSWNDLLLSHSQHFWFPKNAFWESDFEKMLDAVFMRPQNFGTKFKIQKNCWLFVESLTCCPRKKFSSALGRVNSSIHNIPVLPISSECWGKTQI